jgi:hypothetical protein
MSVPGRKAKGESDDAGPGNYLYAGGFEIHAGIIALYVREMPI